MPLGLPWIYPLECTPQVIYLTPEALKRQEKVFVVFYAKRRIAFLPYMMIFAVVRRSASITK